MNPRKFSHGVVMAAALATVAGVAVAGLLPFVGFSAVARLLIPGLALAYVLFLLRGSNEPIGRLTTLVAWTTVSIVTWWFSPALPLYLLVHVAMIWLIRSLYYYSSFLPAIADAGIGALSVASLTWAATRSGSVFLATWCFFLVQALSAMLPLRRASRPPTDATEDSRFQDARRQADAALRQLYS